ncbi:hypothetical protein [Bacillus sp. USDA818B3_A]|uniref:hypothetical protein n=1 Tax=Bacillus sp. USDA818B3_A TaxID=2698834 RepID=UPI003FA414B0
MYTYTSFLILFIKLLYPYFHLPVNTSVRSVAVEGVLDKFEISVYISSVILKPAAAYESSNWSKLRAPMIGAVTAGLAISQATAKVAGFTSCSCENLVNCSAVTKSSSAVTVYNYGKIGYFLLNLTQFIDF